MPMARSKVTAQGQISVPAEVRRRLGVGPGSVLEWHEEDGKIVVRDPGDTIGRMFTPLSFPTSIPSLERSPN